jgi:hypothetical protein
MTAGYGSVYKRTTRDGKVRWAWSFTTGSWGPRDPVTKRRDRGTRRTHSKGGYATERAAKKALAEATVAYGRGDKRPVQKAVDTPTGQYLAEWLAALPLERRTTPTGVPDRRRRLDPADPPDPAEGSQPRRPARPVQAAARDRQARRQAALHPQRAAGGHHDRHGAP